MMQPGEMMRPEAFIDHSERKATLIRWLIVILCLVGLLLFASRVAGSHEHSASWFQFAAVDVVSAAAPCDDRCAHAGPASCHGALSCHAGLAQVGFSEPPSPGRASFAWQEARSLAGLIIAPLFHPPKRIVQV